MPLVQFYINWDDISSFSAQTSLTPITILRPVNLNGGAYRARVVGFTWNDTLAAAVGAVNQTIINVNSSKFSFPGSANQGIFFTNRQEHVNPSIHGHLDFYIENVANSIDLVLYAQAFNANRTENNAATWDDSGFLAMILTLDLEKIDKKVPYGVL
jgi:hypothetical protein